MHIKILHYQFDENSESQQSVYEPLGYTTYFEGDNTLSSNVFVVEMYFPDDYIMYRRFPMGEGKVIIYISNNEGKTIDKREVSL